MKFMNEASWDRIGCVALKRGFPIGRVLARVTAGREDFMRNAERQDPFRAWDCRYPLVGRGARDRHLRFDLHEASARGIVAVATAAETETVVHR